jgi:hypothetical protein
VGEVRLLKMDIEGAEVLALRLRAASARGRIRNLLLELHPPQITALKSSVGEVIGASRARGISSGRCIARRWWPRAAAYGRLQDPSALLKPLKDDALDSWPHVLASREPKPFG